MAEKKRKINLLKVKVVNVDGSEQELDLSKDIASNLYNRAMNVEEASASMELFKTGECDYSEALRDSILKLLDTAGYFWPVRQGVIKALGES